jgi:hypothetical protein
MGLWKGLLLGWTPTGSVCRPQSFAAGARGTGALLRGSPGERRRRK